MGDMCGEFHENRHKMKEDMGHKINLDDSGNNKSKSQIKKIPQNRNLAKVEFIVLELYKKIITLKNLTCLKTLHLLF